MAASKQTMDMDQKMRQKGYEPVTDIAKRLGKDISTVYRWLDSGEVEGEDVMGRRYVLLRSVIVNKVGIRGAVLLDLITEEQAKKLAANK